MTNPSEILDPKLMEAVALIHTASAVAIAAIGDDLAKLCGGSEKNGHLAMFTAHNRIALNGLAQSGLSEEEFVRAVHQMTAPDEILRQRYRRANASHTSASAH